MSPWRSAYQRKTDALVMKPCFSSRADSVSIVSPAFTVKFTGLPGEPGGSSWRTSQKPTAPTARIATVMMARPPKPKNFGQRRCLRSRSLWNV